MKSLRYLSLGILCGFSVLNARALTFGQSAALVVCGATVASAAVTVPTFFKFMRDRQENAVQEWIRKEIAQVLRRSLQAPRNKNEQLIDAIEAKPVRKWFFTRLPDTVQPKVINFTFQGIEYNGYVTTKYYPFIGWTEVTLVTTQLCWPLIGYDIKPSPVQRTIIR